MEKKRPLVALFDGYEKAVYLWGVIDFVFLAIFNVLEGKMIFLLYFVFMVLGYTLLYMIAPSRYYMTIFLLCIIEETIVYYMGGGLHGQAKSLIHDYLRSLPIFMAHAYLWRNFMSKYRYQDRHIFIMAGLHGFFWEIIISGAIINPILTALFGGTTFLLYGLLVLIPERPKGTGDIDLRKTIILWFYYLIIEIVTGVLFAILFP